MAALRSSSPLLLAGLLLLALVAACSGRAAHHKLQLRSRQGGRIVGGSAVDISQYPWQVYLLSTGTIFAEACGASIISSNWILTAAHCIVDSTLDQLTIRAGSSLSSSGGVVFTIASGSYHANYDANTLDYDIGVLQASGSVIGAGGVAAAVSLASSDPAVGQSVTVTGWGTTSFGGSTSDQLLAVTVSIIDKSTCGQAYGTIPAWKICAGDPNGGKDACQGDSGGPLVSGSTQVGIVSSGFECAVAGYPGLYTSVANLRSWISQVTGV